MADRETSQSVQIPAQATPQSVHSQCKFLHRLQLSQCADSATSCTDYSSVSAQSVQFPAQTTAQSVHSQCTVSAISCTYYSSVSALSVQFPADYSWPEPLMYGISSRDPLAHAQCMLTVLASHSCGPRNSSQLTKQDKDQHAESYAPSLLA
jgi:hypothetical protein